MIIQESMMAANLHLKQKIISQSFDFINNESDHNNNIKNLWLCMKSEMIKQHGFKKIILIYNLKN